MNKTNIQHCINIMLRAKNFKMGKYQASQIGSWVTSEEQLEEDGNTANLAGYIAISPEFQRDGGRVCPRGSPQLGDRTGPKAVAEWLDLPVAKAVSLIWGPTAQRADICRHLWVATYESELEGLYPSQEVFPKDVVVALREILKRDTEIEKFNQEFSALCEKYGVEMYIEDKENNIVKYDHGGDKL